MARAIVVLAVTTAVGLLVYHKLGVTNTDVLMLYLVGVLWVSTRDSRGVAVLTSMLGVLLFDLLFVPPYYALSVHDPKYMVTFTVMLLTALLISTLTYRARTQAESARLAWERAEAEFLRNTLLSGVSHDLRTPLAAIAGAASALRDAGESLPPVDRREMLTTLCAEVDRMERLIENLLDMTRLESGGVVLKREWQPLHEAVGAALHHMDRRLGERAVAIDIRADLPLVFIDGVGIQQVLVNLLDNALQHTPPGSPLELGARAEADEVIVELADHGPGLPPGTEHRVFEKFFHIHAGGHHHGAGLGLAICKGIVEAHGGTIVAANRPGGGAVFRFTIPASQTPPLVDGSA